MTGRHAAGATGVVLVPVPSPGTAVPDNEDLETLRLATQDMLRVDAGAGRAEYERFVGIARRGIAVDATGLLDLHRGATILVTGGTGCIGSALLAQLVQLEPARIVSISRGLESKWPAIDGVEYHRLDVRNGPAVAELFRSVRPDVVYHLAAQHDPGLAEREMHRTLSTNVTGTANVIQACRALPGVRLASASTGKALRPFTGDIYAASKKMTEWLLAECAASPSMTVSAVRFTHIVDNSIILSRLREWCASESPIRLHSLETMFYAQSAREAAQLLLSSLLEARPGRLTLAAIRDLDWPVSLLELALGVLSTTSSRSPIYVCGFEDGYERAPYPGLYDPLVSGSVSPLYNAVEASAVEPGSACPDIDIIRPPVTGSTRVGALIRQLCRSAAADAPRIVLRSAVDACGWAKTIETIT